MAAKTTRFFIQLCHLAELDLGFDSKNRPSNKIKKESTNGPRPYQAGFGTSNDLPLVIALTPDIMAMDTDQLAEFLKKLKVALKKASAS